MCSGYKVAVGVCDRYDPGACWSEIEKGGLSTSSFPFALGSAAVRCRKCSFATITQVSIRKIRFLHQAWGQDPCQEVCEKIIRQKPSCVDAPVTRICSHLETSFLFLRNELMREAMDLWGYRFPGLGSADAAWRMAALQTGRQETQRHAIGENLPIWKTVLPD